jgi:hypothetical protein
MRSNSERFPSRTINERCLDLIISQFLSHTTHRSLEDLALVITNASVIRDEFHRIDVRISSNSSRLGEDSFITVSEFQTVKIFLLYPFLK